MCICCHWGASQPRRAVCNSADKATFQSFPVCYVYRHAGMICEMSSLPYAAAWACGRMTGWRSFRMTRATAPRPAMWPSLTPSASLAMLQRIRYILGNIDVVETVPSGKKGCTKAMPPLCHYDMRALLERRPLGLCQAMPGAPKDSSLSHDQAQLV